MENDVGVVVTGGGATRPHLASLGDPLPRGEGDRVTLLDEAADLLPPGEAGIIGTRGDVRDPGGYFVIYQITFFH